MTTNNELVNRIANLDKRMADNGYKGITLFDAYTMSTPVEFTVKTAEILFDALDEKLEKIVADLKADIKKQI